MKLCLITPTGDIQLTNELSGRFCLANIFMRAREYREYFIKENQSGRQIIFDNGVFEDDCLSDALLIEQMKFFSDPKNVILIAPDKIGAPGKENIAKALAFTDLLNMESTFCPQIMYVPQCPRKGTTDFLDQMSFLLREKHPFKAIGFCRDTLYNAFGHLSHTDDQELNRYWFSVYLQEHQPSIFENLRKKFYIHFLGLGDRLDLLKYYWWADSVDTANICWRTMDHQVLMPDGHWQLEDPDRSLQMRVNRPYNYFELGKSLSDTGDLMRRNCRTVESILVDVAKMKSRMTGGRI
jgi:hypothetical protein